MGVDGERHALPAPLSGINRYQMFRMLSASHCRSGRTRKISLQQGFDPRTVQPVASLYNGHSIPVDVINTLRTGDADLRF